MMYYTHGILSHSQPLDKMFDLGLNQLLKRILFQEMRIEIGSILRAGLPVSNSSNMYTFCFQETEQNSSRDQIHLIVFSPFFIKETTSVTF